MRFGNNIPFGVVEGKNLIWFLDKPCGLIKGVIMLWFPITGGGTVGIQNLIWSSGGKN